MVTLYALGRALAPRLLHRLRTGQWCDHKTYRYRSWMDEVDDATGAIVGGHPAPSVGWEEWELADCGRMKIRFCARCGHMETTEDSLRKWLGRWWLARGDQRTRKALAFSAVAGIAVGVVLFSLVVASLPLLIIGSGVCAAYLIAMLRDWPQ